MSDDKRYYWLKLGYDFFTSKEVKKLRSIAGGDTYTVVYLKMMLFSLETDGVLLYEGIEDTMEEEIAISIDEEPENVKITLQFLVSKGLAKIVNGSDLEMLQVKDMTGSETGAARRKRAFREGKALQEWDNVPQLSQTCPIEIEKEKDKELEKETETDTATPTKQVKRPYGELQNVYLTDDEISKLSAEYGQETAMECIKYLDIYIAEKAYKSKSHYLAIKRWVMDAVKKKPKNNKTSSNPFERFI